MEPEQAQAPAGAAGTTQPAGDQGKRKRGAIATAVAIGAVLLEPELLPGIAIGVAAMAIPKYFPEAMVRLRPLAEGARRVMGEAAAHGRSLGERARGLGQRTFALGQKLTTKTKEKIAHVAGRTVPNQPGQPA